jgi:glutamyl-tRNA synthetase
VAEQLGFGEKAGKVFQPLRVALTGLAASPGIFDVLVILGRQRALARIDDAIAYLRAPSGSPAS